MHDGELAVTAWERLVPVEAEPDWRAVGQMVARVHALTVDDLPPAYPVPHGEDFPWWQFDELLADVGELLDPAARRGIEAAIDRHGRWAEGVDRVVCHGDVHPGNVVATTSGTVLLDWDLLCLAPAAWDHSAMLTWASRWGGPPQWYDEFAAGYGRSMERRPRGRVARRAPAGRGHADAAAGRPGRPGGDARGPAAAGVLAWRPRGADVDAGVSEQTEKVLAAADLRSADARSSEERMPELKTEAELAVMREAGQIVAAALDAARRHAAVGVSLRELDEVAAGGHRRPRGAAAVPELPPALGAVAVSRRDLRERQRRRRARHPVRSAARRR